MKICQICLIAAAGSSGQKLSFLIFLKVNDESNKEDHFMPLPRDARNADASAYGMGKLTISNKFILAFAPSISIVSMIVLQSWDLSMLGGIKCNEYLPLSTSQSERTSMIGDVLAQ